VGTLLGKAQRYVADVKAEVNRSMELDELKKMKDTVENAARDVEQTIQTSASDFEKRLGADHGRAGRTARVRPVSPPTSIPGKNWRLKRAPRPVVQGPQRRAHQGPVGRGARGALPSAEIPTDAAPSARMGGPDARALFTMSETQNPARRRTRRHRAAVCAAPRWSCATA
jgi:hypothetical protein